MTHIRTELSLASEAKQLIGTPDEVFAKIAKIQEGLVVLGFDASAARYSKPVLIPEPTADGLTNYASEELRAMHVAELELGVRSYNCLDRAGIRTLGQLLDKSKSELGDLPNFGGKSVDEVVEVLAARGLKLRDL